MIQGPELILFSSTQAVSLAVPQEIKDMADREMVIAIIISDRRVIIF